MMKYSDPWQSLPLELTPFRAGLPSFEVLSVPAFSLQDLGKGRNPIRDVVGINGFANVNAISPYGVGRAVVSGKGWGIDSAYVKESRLRAYGLICFYVESNTATNFPADWLYNGSLGAGTISLSMTSSGVLAVTANDNNFGKAIVTFSNYDARGKLTCVAASYELAGGTLVARAALNGVESQENSVASAFSPLVGIHLEINKGNGFSGWAGNVLYVGQSWSDRMLSLSELRLLSTPFYIFEPKRRAYFVSAVAGNPYWYYHQQQVLAGVNA